MTCVTSSHFAETSLLNQQVFLLPLRRWIYQQSLVILLSPSLTVLIPSVIIQ